MRKCGFEHQGASTYLVYELEPGDQVDSMSLGMLMNNQIPGFASTIITQRDSIKQMKCDVTARVAADQYLLGTVNKRMLLSVFQGIIQAFLSAEEYMMDPGTIQLDLGSIFVDVPTGKTVMICMPVTDEEKKPEGDLRSFLKGILFGAQYDERENRDYVAKIMSYLNGTPSFSVREFKELLNYVDIMPAIQQPQQPLAPGQQYAASAYTQAAPAPVPKPEDAVVPPVEIPSEPGKDETQEPHKQMSLFYLLQHYNKDNAAMYKEGKELRKAKKEAEKREKAERKQAEKREKAERKQAEKKGAPQGSFAVPGQENAPSAATVSGPPEFASQPVQALPAQPAQPFQSFPAQQFQSAQSLSAQPQPVQPIQPFPTQQIQPIQQIQPFPVEMPSPAQPAFPPAASMSTGERAREDTVYFPENGDDATVLMGQEPSARRLNPYLIRKRNQERIPINKAIFRLGRDRDYNDYPIVGNRYIGHSHCHIICREGEYFVVDDNSKNSTKVNGEAITPGTEVKIAHGYIICLADEEFEFNLY